MKSPLLIVACGLLAFATTASAVTPPEKIPTQNFCAPAAFSSLHLSPDGKRVSYVVESDKDIRLMFRELDSGQLFGVELPAMFASFFGKLGNTVWVSEKRFLLESYQGYWAVDNDGGDYLPVSGYDRKYQTGSDGVYLWAGNVLHTFRGEDSDWVVMTENDQAGTPTKSGWITATYPNVIRLNTRTQKYFEEVRNPGNIVGWATDKNGVVRVGLKVVGLKRSVIYRENERAPWETLPGLGVGSEDFGLLALDETGQRLYISKTTEDGRYGVFAYDLKRRSVGEMIVGHKLYDITAPYGAGGLIMNRNHELLGVTYKKDLPRVFWMDPGMLAIQRAIDQQLPKTFNQFAGASDDWQHLLFYSYSDREPGTYYRFDRKKTELIKVVPTRPWINPDQMAPMFPFDAKSRDGLTLHGYLTLPVGRAPKNLPMVVMPHGGPWARDSWSFDPQVQFLANRGYAVLQVNYRGSTGYGREFYEKGFREIGKAIQDDIADAARWAIEKGVADSKRMAIMGGSYGGYSVLMGLIQTPELYCCGIDIAGVTDWVTLIEHGAEMFPLSLAYNADRIGDPTKDKDALRAISPVYHVDRIRAPLLIIHGKDDPTVPYDQATELMAALDRAHKPYETLAKFNEPHGIYHFKNRVQMYDQVEQFLAKYMAAQ